MRSLLLALLFSKAFASYAACPTPEVDSESLNEPSIVRVNEQTRSGEVSYDEGRTWKDLHAVEHERLATWEAEATVQPAQYLDGCPPPVISCPVFVIPRFPLVFIAPPRRLPPPVELYARPRIRTYEARPYAMRRTPDFVYYRYGRRW